jgi:RNA polymerase sigma-B factor
MGLVLAVDRFEPGRGFDFLSFAVLTITGEVLRHFRIGPTRSGCRAGCLR